MVRDDGCVTAESVLVELFAGPDGGQQLFLDLGVPVSASSCQRTADERQRLFVLQEGGAQASLARVALYGELSLRIVVPQDRCVTHELLHASESVLMR